LRLARPAEELRAEELREELARRDAVTGQLAAELTVLKRLMVRRWPCWIGNGTA
jgi:hypothetical protein